MVNAHDMFFSLLAVSEPSDMASCFECPFPPSPTLRHLRVFHMSGSIC